MSLNTCTTGYFLMFHAPCPSEGEFSRIKSFRKSVGDATPMLVAEPLMKPSVSMVPSRPKLISASKGPDFSPKSPANSLPHPKTLASEPKPLAILSLPVDWKNPIPAAILMAADPNIRAPFAISLPDVLDSLTSSFREPSMDAVMVL